MLCEKCKSREATVHKQAIINGQSHSEHLCAECAAKENGSFGSFFDDFDQFFQGSMFGGNPISDWFQPFFQSQNATTKTRQLSEQNACPHCGTTWEQFQKNGLLGCKDCYEHFSDELPPLLRRLHGHTDHIGKAPEKVIEKPLSKKEELQKAMSKAIADENFEEAARIRDKIKSLDQQGTEGADA